MLARRLSGVALALLIFSAEAAARSVYLNGQDISSARNQELKNVSLIINEHGDVFIVAPHYQVNEQDSYVPLSKYVQGVQGGKTPTHKEPQAITRDEVPHVTGGGTVELDASGDEAGGEAGQEKAGSKSKEP